MPLVKPLIVRLVDVVVPASAHEPPEFVLVSTRYSTMVPPARSVGAVHVSATEFAPAAIVGELTTLAMPVNAALTVT